MIDVRTVSRIHYISSGRVFLPKERSFFNGEKPAITISYRLLSMSSPEPGLQQNPPTGNIRWIKRPLQERVKLPAVEEASIKVGYDLVAKAELDYTRADDKARALQA